MRKEQHDPGIQHQDRARSDEGEEEIVAALGLSEVVDQHWNAEKFSDWRQAAQSFRPRNIDRPKQSEQGNNAYSQRCYTGGVPERAKERGPVSRGQKCDGKGQREYPGYGGLPWQQGRCDDGEVFRALPPRSLGKRTIRAAPCGEAEPNVGQFPLYCDVHLTPHGCYLGKKVVEICNMSQDDNCKPARLPEGL